MIYVIIDAAATCLDIGLFLFLLQNEEVKGRGIKQIVLFLVWVIAVIIMTQWDLTAWPKILIQILILVVIGKFVYRCSILKLSFYGILYVFALFLSEEVIIGIWNIYNRPMLADNIIYEDFIISLVIAMKAFYFLIIMILKKIVSKNKEERNFKEFVPILCIGIPFLLIMECLNILMPQIHGTTERVFYLLTCTAILFSFIYVLIFLQKYLKMERMAQAEKAALYELQVRYGYYEKRREDEERVRKIYHDLKNHLLLLKNDKAVTSITKKIESYESYIMTGNEFLDIIISEKIKMAQKSNIFVECDIDFRAGVFIEALDISTIFGNLIDNAIEAAEKVEESEKYMFIKVQKKEGFIIIVIKNSMQGIFLNRTSKSNKTFHGYGLTNVKRAIKKYYGDINIDSNNKEFVISIVIPIPGDGIGEKENYENN